MFFLRDFGFLFVPSFPFGADVVAYSTHVPSFADSWGWVMVCKKKKKIILFLL